MHSKNKVKKYTHKNAKGNYESCYILPYKSITLWKLNSRTSKNSKKRIVQNLIYECNRKLVYLQQLASIRLRYCYIAYPFCYQVTFSHPCTALNLLFCLTCVFTCVLVSVNVLLLIVVQYSDLDNIFTTNKYYIVNLTIIHIRSSLPTNIMNCKCTWNRVF